MLIERVLGFTGEIYLAEIGHKRMGPPDWRIEHMSLGKGTREGGLIHNVDGEAGAHKHVVEVEPIDPQVVILPELQKSSIRVRDGRVFDGFFQVVLLRDRKDGVSPRLENPVDFSHGHPVIGHVFQHIDGDANVISPVRNPVHVRDVQLNVYVPVGVAGCDEIRLDVFTAMLHEKRLEAFFRRKVEHGLAGKQPFLEERIEGTQSGHKQTVPDLGPALGANDISVPLVAFEAIAPVPADIAFLYTPTAENSQHLFEACDNPSFHGTSLWLVLKPSVQDLPSTHPLSLMRTAERQERPEEFTGRHRLTVGTHRFIYLEIIILVYLHQTRFIQRPFS
jgi:hypothetical protein